MSAIVEKAGLVWSRFTAGLNNSEWAKEKTPEETAGFLPNFCKGDMLVSIIIIAELLALVVTLVTTRITQNIFWDLLLITISFSGSP